MSTPAAGVIFDLDGVLIDSEPLQYEAYGEVLRRFGIEVDRAEYARHWIAEGRGPEYAVEHYRLPLTPDELRHLKNPVYHRMLRERVRLRDGARAALDRLAARYPLALATNSNAEDVAFVLDHFALRRYFRDVLTRERYRRAKPEPDAFLAAAAALGLPPGRCVVIEDAYKGVVAAARAGCPCVAVPHELTRDNDFRAASRVVGSLDEIVPELIEELVAPSPAPGVRTDPEMGGEQ